MERLFSPCTRLHDILESQGDLEEFRGLHPERLQELNLDVSTEELLSAEKAFTYVDLYATIGSGETVAWLTPHAAVMRADGIAMDCWEQLDESFSFCLSADGKQIVAVAHSSEHLLEIVDVVIRLLAVSVAHSVSLSHWRSLDFTSINTPSLAYLMEQCQSLKVLSFNQLKMDEEHCRVLGASSRPGLEIELNCCPIRSAGASALLEVLGRNQGPTKLDSCYIDNVVLADGLRGNSRLKSWRPYFSSDLEVRDREFIAITDALRENKGLVDLDLSDGGGVNDETWGAICDSLKTHPTLEILYLCAVSMSPVVLKTQIQTLVDMLKVNISIHTMHLGAHSRHELYRESVVPYLETNRFRPRVLAIQKTRPIPYRAKVLGSALLAARTDANSFWMLLSGNAEVSFP
jgi:hypothetical protein